MSTLVLYRHQFLLSSSSIWQVEKHNERAMVEAMSCQATCMFCMFYHFITWTSSSSELQLLLFSIGFTFRQLSISVSFKHQQRNDEWGNTHFNSTTNAICEITIVQNELKMDMTTGKWFNYNVLLTWTFFCAVVIASVQKHFKCMAILWRDTTSSYERQEKIWHFGLKTNNNGILMDWILC